MTRSVADRLDEVLDDVGAGEYGEAMRHYLSGATVEDPDVDPVVAVREIFARAAQDLAEEDTSSTSAESEDAGPDRLDIRPGSGTYFVPALGGGILTSLESGDRVVQFHDSGPDRHGARFFSAHRLLRGAHGRLVPHTDNHYTDVDGWYEHLLDVGVPKSVRWFDRNGNVIEQSEVTD